MSPEVVLQQDMGRPMDIWSIGCVVVEMYTSKVCFFVFAIKFMFVLATMD